MVTMPVVTGESLFNDGTAIVLFNLFFFQIQGNIYSTTDVIKYVFSQVIGAPLLGVALAMLCYVGIVRASRKEVEMNPIIQTCLTIAVAYLTYFTADEVLGISGVLGTVSCSLVIAARAWPHFCSHNMVEHVWHTIEFLANTLIFMLAGLIIGDVFYHETQTTKIFQVQHHFHKATNTSVEGLKLLEFKTSATVTASDVGWLFLLYVVCVAIRFVVLCACYPLIKAGRCQHKFNLREVLLMCWGGLRGAVGLALAITVRIYVFAPESHASHRLQDGAFARRQDLPCAWGSQIMFLVGGVAVLTLLLNATTCALVLNALGLNPTNQSKNLLLKVNVLVIVNQYGPSK